MPIMKGGERKKKAKRAEQAKNAILLSFMAFFFMYNRIGFVNRMMFCLVSTQGLIFLTKSNFYKQCVEELNYEMTLTGQESRILTQYYFDNHPQKQMFSQLCEKYQQHSKTQKEKESTRMAILEKNMGQQKKLDQEFADRLKRFDMIDDE